jgi:hypothetical protein
VAYSIILRADINISHGTAGEMPMHLLPLPFSLLLVLLLGLIVWGILRVRSPEDSSEPAGTGEGLLWGLLLLAGLAIIVFISFLLLGVRT